MRLSTEKTRTATSTHPGIPCHNHTAVPPRYFHPHAFGRCALCPRQTVRRDALNHTAPCTRMAVRYGCTRREIAPQLQRVRSGESTLPPCPKSRANHGAAPQRRTDHSAFMFREERTRANAKKATGALTIGRMHIVHQMHW